MHTGFAEPGSSLRSLLLTAVLWSQAAAGQIDLSEGTNISVDVSGDGRLATDLLGSIWVLPATGGRATALTDSPAPAGLPRWSPDNQTILFHSESAHGVGLRLLDVESRTSIALGEPGEADHFGNWHPDGERIVFSSERHDSGLDVWEMDIPSGLSWRLSDAPGDETEPAWSVNGRHLAYIHKYDGQWTLMLRRFGQTDEIIHESQVPLLSLAWRPDGSLLTFMQHQDEGLQLNMAILSDPPLIRQIADDEDYFRFPVSWQDRQKFYYTADGAIKSRRFDERRSREIAFQAEVGRPAARSVSETTPRELPLRYAPEQRLVVRGARLFDGIAAGYRNAMDVVIEKGLITAIEKRRDWPDAQVLDLGDVSIFPGFIDAYSAMPDGNPQQIGAELLSYGITSIVLDDDLLDDDQLDDNATEFDYAQWDTEGTPGPRLLLARSASTAAAAGPGIVLATLVGGDAAVQANDVRTWQQRGVPVLAKSWNVGLSLGTDLLLGAESLPASPRGIRYQDVQLAVSAGPITLVSGLADAATPGLAALFDSRQARQFGHQLRVPRRYAAIPVLSDRSSGVVLGSKPNGLPAGLALHAELRALAAAGLSSNQVMLAAGVNASRVLGFSSQIGVIAPGALADMVLLLGDPLLDLTGSIDIVAVVRNGRFFSLVGLLERAASAANVE